MRYKVTLTPVSVAIVNIVWLSKGPLKVTADVELYCQAGLIYIYKHVGAGDFFVICGSVHIKRNIEGFMSKQGINFAFNSVRLLFYIWTGISSGYSGRVTVGHMGSVFADQVARQPAE